MDEEFSSTSFWRLPHSPIDDEHIRFPPPAPPAAAPPPPRPPRPPRPRRPPPCSISCENLSAENDGNAYKGEKGMTR